MNLLQTNNKRKNFIFKKNWKKDKEVLCCCYSNGHDNTNGHDPLFKPGPMYNIILTNFRVVYKSNQALAIDESIVA